MNNIKCIYFPFSNKEYDHRFDSLTNNFETVFLDKNKCEFYSTWKHNELHLTNKSQYNYVLPNLAKLLNFEYNLDDFILVNKYDKTDKYDISYLFPKNDKNFLVHYRGEDKLFKYKDLIGYSDYNKYKKYFLENTSFKDMNPDYHLLFFAPHQCCIIKNLCGSNDRKLLISGDSQLIPLMPILAYYFKEIVYLDKRSGDYLEKYNINIEEYDILYCLSKYDYNKYVFTNFRKISFLDKLNTAIVACCKLENNYLREWVEYHYKLGFSKIFLYDNNDIDGEKPEEVIGDYIKSDFVKVIDKRGLVARKNFNLQNRICKEGYLEASKEYDWIAIIDIDEYITFNGINNIKNYLLLPIFNNYECIRLNWKLYNDNDLIKVENNNYNLHNRFETWKPHPLGKTIFRSNLNLSTLCGHGSKDAIPCDEIGNKLEYYDRISIVSKNPKYLKAWVNHYKTKTIEEFILIRMKRKDMNINLQLDSYESFFSYCKRTPEKEKYAKELIKRLKNENINNSNSPSGE